MRKLYHEQILPRGVEWLMSGKRFNGPRARAVSRAQGEVVEVGFGAGLNLRHYTSRVTKVHAIEPATLNQHLAAARIDESSVPVEFTGLDGQHIPLPERSVDTVVTTWTLCSIPNIAQALAEFRRVLRSDGQVVFVEHGHAPDRGVQRWQKRMNPVHQFYAGGCRLNLKVDRALEESGFGIECLDTYYMGRPHFASFTYEGVARPI